MKKRKIEEIDQATANEENEKNLQQSGKKYEDANSKRLDQINNNHSKDLLRLEHEIFQKKNPFDITNSKAEGQKTLSEKQEIKGDGKPNLSFEFQRAPPSVLSKLQAFLPQLAAANQDLESLPDKSSVNMEAVGKRSPYIEMNLGLGIFGDGGGGGEDDDQDGTCHDLPDDQEALHQLLLNQQLQEENESDQESDEISEHIESETDPSDDDEENNSKEAISENENETSHNEDDEADLQSDHENDNDDASDESEN